MSSFNFDVPIDRTQTDSIRWDPYKNQDVIPLWVADMDFTSAPCVIEALQKRVQHGVYGYTHAPHQLRETIAQHLLDEYNWKIDPAWIVFLPSVVSGLYTAVRQLSNVSEDVLIPKPVYHHLRLACSQSNRSFTEIPLELNENRWVLPFNELNTFIKNNCKLALLCNPQNPGGTMFTREELENFAYLCEQNNLWICSDEIHAGLVLDESKKHIPIASLSPEISKRTVTLMSLNKTFNFPGIGLAWAIAENPELRKKMQTDLHATISEPSLLAYTCTQAALANGGPWRSELIQYLRKNREAVYKTINSIDGLSCSKIEASYLAWIDCRSFAIPNLQDFFIGHGVALSPGEQFHGPGFMRLNFGTQHERLIMALERIRKGVETL